MVDVNLAVLIVAVKRDYPKWVERGLEQYLSPITHDYSYAELVRRGPGVARATPEERSPRWYSER